MYRFWREGIILALSAACYFLYHTRGGPDCPTIPAVTQEKVEVNQTVTTVTTKPDGTKVEKTITTEKKTKEKTKPSDKVLSAARKSQYDVHFTHDGRDFRSVGVGARLGELPAFGTLDYELKTKAVLLGIRVEF